MKLRTVVSILFFGSLGLADIMPQTAIPDLFQKAHCVFAGRVVGVHRLPQRPETEGTDWSIDFSSLRVYKGDPSILAVTVSVLDFNPSWGPPMNSGETVIVFAAESLSGRGLVLAERLSYMAFTLTEIERGRTGIGHLEADAVTIALGAGESARQTIEFLTRFPVLGTRTLDLLAAHPPLNEPQSEDIRLALLARADTHTYLSQLAASVSSREAAEIGGVPVLFHVISDLAGQSDIEALKLLANGNSKAVRLAALLGIRRLRDPANIEFLVSKLRASDSDEAYEAMVGLAETTGRKDLAIDLGDRPWHL